MLTEEDVKQEINEALINKGWFLSGPKKNVYMESPCGGGRADYFLQGMDKKPLMVIEAKRKGKDLDEALKQAIGYAAHLKAPLAFASNGSITKAVHVPTLKPLFLNGEEVDYFIAEKLALNFLPTNEYTTLDKKIIQSRKELINIFSNANKELRREGLQAGVERFSEFCNILFLKLFSEQEQLREEAGEEPRIESEF